MHPGQAEFYDLLKRHYQIGRSSLRTNMITCSINYIERPCILLPNGQFKHHHVANTMIRTKYDYKIEHMPPSTRLYYH